MNIVNFTKYGLLAAMLIAVSLGAYTTEAAAVTNITSCTTITQSGSFKLVQNLVTPLASLSDNCLQVQADFVDVDLNGHTIRGKGGVGDGITDLGVARQGIVVRNGTITDFDFGIDLRASRNNIVEGVRAIGNSGFGIHPGIESTVIGNIAADNGGFGIASGLGNFGGNGGNGGTVTGNSAYRNGGAGIFVICPANVIGNTAIDNDPPNLFLAGSGCNNNNNVAP